MQHPQVHHRTSNLLSFWEMKASRQVHAHEERAAKYTPDTIKYSAMFPGNVYLIDFCRGTETALASHKLTDLEPDRLEEALNRFREFDIDHNNVLSKAEFLFLLRSTIPGG